MKEGAVDAGQLAEIVRRDVVSALRFDVDRQKEAVAAMERRGLVMDMDLSKPFEQLTEGERWQKLAFTFYTALCMSAARAEDVLAALERDISER